MAGPFPRHQAAVVTRSAGGSAPLFMGGLGGGGFSPPWRSVLAERDLCCLARLCSRAVQTAALSLWGICVPSHPSRRRCSVLGLARRRSRAAPNHGAADSIACLHQRGSSVIPLGLQCRARTVRRMVTPRMQLQSACLEPPPPRVVRLPPLGGICRGPSGRLPEDHLSLGVLLTKCSSKSPAYSGSENVISLIAQVLCPNQRSAA
jgi:hypothetical protein